MALICLGGWCQIWADKSLWTGKVEKERSGPLPLSWKIMIYNLDWKTDLNKIGLIITGFMVKTFVLITPGAYERMLLSSTNM